MKKILFFALASLLLSGATMMTSCDKGDDTGNGSGGGTEIVMIDMLTCMYQDAENNTAVIAMLPNGTGRKWLYRQNETIALKQASIGSDGRTLLFSCNADGGVYTLDLADPSAGPEKIYATPDFEVPVFSPDMSRVYGRDDDSGKFCWIDPATGKVTPLLEEHGAVLVKYPSFNADGNIVCDYDWGANIAVMKADGSDLTLLKEPAYNYHYRHPLAVPAHDKIVYNVVDKNNDTWIRIMNNDGTGDALLLGPLKNLSAPSVNAAGTRMAYQQKNSIRVGDFNGSSVSNTTVVSDTEEEEFRIWRPLFQQILPEVYQALPDFE